METIEMNNKDTKDIQTKNQKIKLSKEDKYMSKKFKYQRI